MNAIIAAEWAMMCIILIGFMFYNLKIGLIFLAFCVGFTALLLGLTLFFKWLGLN